MSVYKNTEIDIALVVNITKSTEAGLVSGWASVAKNRDGSIPMDWEDDMILPEELERAAMAFMHDYAESGIQHQGPSVGRVVESIVFTKEKQRVLGIPPNCVPEGWFITVQLHDEVAKQKVRTGACKMFSIQGSAKRIPLN
jgi:hypothetical protein